MVVFLVINTLAIAARLYVRMRLLTRAFGVDDTILCLVFVSFPRLGRFSHTLEATHLGRSLAFLILLHFSNIKFTERIRDSLRLGVRIYVLGIRGS